MRDEGPILDLASKQQGLIATWQLRALGLDRDQVAALRRSRGWTERSARVLERTGVPESEHRVLMAGVLDASPGAAISESSAAWMWSVPGWFASPVHVVRPKGVSRRPSTLAIVHEVVDLDPSQIKVLDGIPVVSPARLVCELCGSNPHRAERTLDRLWSDRLLDGTTFHRTVLQLAGRGRRGSTLMRELDAARGPRYVPPASSLEARFVEITSDSFARQVDSGGAEWCGRVDFRHRFLPLLVEAQSERYHLSLTNRRDDAARRARLEAAGFRVVEVWDTDVWHRPSIVRGAIDAAIAELAMERRAEPRRSIASSGVG